MMLENKTAAIYGGGGAIGGAVARAFAQAGARAYLAGRSRARLEKVANDIGDAAGVAEVDALDERAVADHADAVAADAGGIDIALNAVSFPFVHDTPLAELAVDEVMHPIDAFLRTNLITTKAVARHMTARRSGTILTLSAARPGRAPREPRLRHHLRGDRGDDPAAGGRARAERRRARLPATAPDRRRTGQRLLHRRAVRAAGRGGGRERRAVARAVAEHVTLLGRLPTLAQVADAAAFLASDGAGDHRRRGRPDLRQRGECDSPRSELSSATTP